MHLKIAEISYSYFPPWYFEHSCIAKTIIQVKPLKKKNKKILWDNNHCKWGFLDISRNANVVRDNNVFLYQPKKKFSFLCNKLFI